MKASETPNTAKQFKKILPVALGIFLAVIVAGALFSLLTGNKTYSVVGEWKSADLIAFPEMIKSFAVAEGIPEDIAALALEITGLDTIGENVSIIFAENGDMLLISNGIAIGSEMLTYRTLENGKIILQFTWKGTILGTSIPISFGYTGDYEVGKDRMSIDFFGYDVTLTRQ